MSTIRSLAILATHVNGAADSGKYDHITTDVVKRELAGGDIFAFLERELGADVDVRRLTDVERHKLANWWRMWADAYETWQFHVDRSGLALLVAYLLHGILRLDSVPPR